MEICEEDSPIQANSEIRPWTAQSFYEEESDDDFFTEEKIVIFRNRIYRILRRY